MRALACAIFALVACVPATAETEPRGAVAMRTEPSVASRGEPFTTSDGWTITVETFALHVSISAQSSEPSLGVLGGGYVLFDGRRREDLVVVGVPRGPAAALIAFSWASVSSEGVYSMADEIRNLPPEVVERFLRAPSVSRGPDASIVIGPSIIVVARARKGDRTLVLDVALRAEPDQHAASVVIVANALTPVAVPLEVEALFTNDDGAVVFDDIAVADTDGDGVLSANELNRTKGQCRTCDPWLFGVPETPGGEPSVLDMIQERTRGVIALPLLSTSWLR